VSSGHQANTSNGVISFPQKGVFEFETDRHYIIHVYPTDTVCVIIKCSELPINIANEDIFTISNILSKVEGYLSSFNVKVPNWREWRLVFYELGVDTVTTFKGKSFDIQSQSFVGTCFHYYSKRFENGDRKARIEVKQPVNTPAENMKVEFVRASELLTHTNSGKASISLDEKAGDIFTSTHPRVENCRLSSLRREETRE
jgi:hypothetical protein